jgi:hypothetical protein
MKGLAGKGENDDFLVSLGRDFYENNLNKLVDRRAVRNVAIDMGLDYDNQHYLKKDDIFQSPMNKRKLYDFRSDYPASPFINIKSPGYPFAHKHLGDSPKEEEEDYAHPLTSFFDKDESMTVGQMFYCSEYQPLHVKHEPQADTHPRKLHAKL